MRSSARGRESCQSIPLSDTRGRYASPDMILDDRIAGHLLVGAQFALLVWLVWPLTPQAWMFGGSDASRLDQAYLVVVITPNILDRSVN